MRSYLVYLTLNKYHIQCTSMPRYFNDRILFLAGHLYGPTHHHCPKPHRWLGILLSWIYDREYYHTQGEWWVVTHEQWWTKFKWYEGHMFLIPIHYCHENMEHVHKYGYSICLFDTPIKFKCILDFIVVWIKCYAIRSNNTCQNSF